jgi:primosomal protein N'
VRLAGRERAQLLVEASSRQTLLPFLRAWYEWLRNVPRRQGVHWRLWGDPEES